MHACFPAAQLRAKRIYCRICFNKLFPCENEACAWLWAWLSLKTHSVCRQRRCVQLLSSVARLTGLANPKTCVPYHLEAWLLVTGLLLFQPKQNASRQLRHPALPRNLLWRHPRPHSAVPSQAQTFRKFKLHPMPTESPIARSKLIRLGGDRASLLSAFVEQSSPGPWKGKGRALPHSSARRKGNQMWSRQLAWTFVIVLLRSAAIQEPVSLASIHELYNCCTSTAIRCVLFSRPRVHT